MLARFYAKNELRADNALKGHIAIVFGRVDRVGKGIADDSFVILGSEMLSNVHCDLTERATADAAKLERGDLIAVRGVVSGLTMGSVMLHECVILATKTADIEPLRSLPRGQRVCNDRNLCVTRM